MPECYKKEKFLIGGYYMGKAGDKTDAGFVKIGTTVINVNQIENI